MSDVGERWGLDGVWTGTFEWRWRMEDGYGAQGQGVTAAVGDRRAHQILACCPVKLHQ